MNWQPPNIALILHHLLKVNDMELFNADHQPLRSLNDLENEARDLMDDENAAEDIRLLATLVATLASALTQSGLYS